MNLTLYLTFKTRGKKRPDDGGKAQKAKTVGFAKCYFYGLSVVKLMLKLIPWQLKMGQRWG